MGKIENVVDVDWAEINTALGQVAYLVASIAHRFGFALKRPFKLCGSMTEIYASASKEENSKYALYFSGTGSNFHEFDRSLSCLLLNI